MLIVPSILCYLRKLPLPKPWPSVIRYRTTIEDTNLPDAALPPFVHDSSPPSPGTSGEFTTRLRFDTTLAAASRSHVPVLRRPRRPAVASAGIRNGDPVDRSEFAKAGLKPPAGDLTCSRSDYRIHSPTASDDAGAQARRKTETFPGPDAGSTFAHEVIGSGRGGLCRLRHHRPGTELRRLCGHRREGKDRSDLQP